MTRINIVDPAQLCDEHLRAEHRELTRIPNCIASGKYDPSASHKIPAEYTIRTEDNPAGGRGHCYFFVNKLQFLYERYQAILAELSRRNFSSIDRWPYQEVRPDTHRKYWNDYATTMEARELNTTRILERTPANPHYCSSTTIPQHVLVN